MKPRNSILLLLFFIVLSMVSIFLTGLALYTCGEVFFFLYKGVPMSFTSEATLFISKVSLYIGSFSGLMLWISNILKNK